MAGILDDIIAHKRYEVTVQQAAVPIAALQATIREMPMPRNLPARLEANGPIAVIAEVKRRSPSKGLIRADFDPVAIALAYAGNGAAAISVLTDERFFGGELVYLSSIRHAVNVPLLRKDFIIDPYQVFQSRAAGADALLLIVAALAPSQLGELLSLTHELHMTALVEAHTAAELETAVSLGAHIVGINNRDLATFLTDLAVTERLAPLVPTGTLLVSESGINMHADLKRVQACGTAAVLVGESLMRETDVSQALRQLLGHSEPLYKG
jgi:indole-3-glycerol phosphate synthase